MIHMYTQSPSFSFARALPMWILPRSQRRVPKCLGESWLLTSPLSEYVIFIKWDDIRKIWYDICKIWYTMLLLYGIYNVWYMQYGIWIWCLICHMRRYDVIWVILYEMIWYTYLGLIKLKDANESYDFIIMIHVHLGSISCITNNIKHGMAQILSPIFRFNRVRWFWPVLVPWVCSKIWLVDPKKTLCGEYKGQFSESTLRPCHIRG